MSEWIEEMENKAMSDARSGSGSAIGKGHLYIHKEIFYDPIRSPQKIGIGNRFYSIDQLQDLVNHMKKYKNVEDWKELLPLKQFP